MPFAHMFCSVCPLKFVQGKNHLGFSFRAEVGKHLPKQLPEPLPVGELGGGDSALSYTAETLEAEMTR